MNFKIDQQNHGCKKMTLKLFPKKNSGKSYTAEQFIITFLFFNICYVAVISKHALIKFVK